MHNVSILRLITPFLLCGCFVAEASLSDGYMLFGAFGGTQTALIDKDGKQIHSWDHNKLPAQFKLNGYSCYLLPNGNMIRSSIVPQGTTSQNAAPRQGALTELNEKGDTVWTYVHATLEKMTHHDFKILSNGNLLAVSFETTLKEDAVAAGMDSTLFGTGFMAVKAVEAEMIFELDRKTKSIVWEWHILDHVTPKAQAAAHPELFSGGLGPFFNGQWVHLNGIDYNEEKKLILFSSRVFSEAYIIDRSTTTDQAAGHTGGDYGKGGDLLYRWGRPANYGATGGTTINCLHSVNWIKTGYPGAGNFIFFHNNVNSSMSSLGSSQVIEINPWDAGGKLVATPNPAQPTWRWTPTNADSMSSKSMSSAYRMKNGNTFVHEAYLDFGKNTTSPDLNTNSRIREITTGGQTLWKYLTTLKGGIDNMSNLNPAKVMYYPSDYPGITELLKKLGLVPVVHSFNDIAASSTRISVRAGSISFSGVADAEVGIFTARGVKVALLRPQSAAAAFRTSGLAAGSYIIRICRSNRVVQSRYITVF